MPLGLHQNDNTGRFRKKMKNINVSITFSLGRKYLDKNGKGFLKNELVRSEILGIEQPYFYG